VPSALALKTGTSQEETDLDHAEGRLSERVIRLPALAATAVAGRPAPS
jgi:hypothetical protein